MKKKEVLIIFLLAVFILTAGGVVVWERKTGPAGPRFAPSPIPTVTTSPKLTQPTVIPTSPTLPLLEEKIRSKGKVPSDLLNLYDEYLAFQEKNTGEEFKPTNSLLRVYGDKVPVDAVASGDVGVLQADLRKLGAVNLTAFGRMVSGRLPILSIDDLSGLDSLQFVRASYMTTQ